MVAWINNIMPFFLSNLFLITKYIWVTSAYLTKGTHTHFIAHMIRRRLIHRCIHPFPQAELGYSFTLLTLLFIAEKGMLDGLS